MPTITRDDDDIATGINEAINLAVDQGMTAAQVKIGVDLASTADTKADTALADAATAQTDATQAISDAAAAQDSVDSLMNGESQIDELSLPTSAQTAVAQSKVVAVDYGESIVFDGDSITAGPSVSGGFTRIYGVVSGLKGNLFYNLDHNQAVSGSTASTAISRVDTTMASQPKVVSVMLGVNDASQEVSADLFIERMQRLVLMYQDRGAELVFVHAPYPKSQNLTSPWTDAMLELWQEYIDRFEEIKVNDNVIIDLESYKTVLDDESRIDNAHLNIDGAIRLGEAHGEFILQYVKKKPTQVNYINDNLFSNPTLEGTGGTLGGQSSGTAPDDTSISCNISGGGAVVVSTGADVFGTDVNHVKMVVSGTSDSSGKICTLTCPVTITAAAAGDRYEITGLFKVESGHNGIVNIAVQAASETRSPSFDQQYEKFNTDREIELFLNSVILEDFAGGETTLNCNYTIKIANNEELDIVAYWAKPRIRKIIDG